MLRSLWIVGFLVFSTLAAGASVATAASESETATARTPRTGHVRLPAVDPLEVEGTIAVAGSSTVYPLARAMYKRFIKAGYRDVMELHNIGSEEGFHLFCAEGVTDIVTASRHITPQESESCIANGRTPIRFRVGIDAIAIVVNTQNDWARNVSFKDLAALFTAEKWSDVNPEWPEERILRFVPNSASGTFAFFVDTVLEGDTDRLAQAPHTTMSADANVLIQEISLERHAIGFLGFAYYKQHAETLRLLGIEGIVPDTTSVTTAKYPLTRPLMLYSDPGILKSKSQVRAFISFFLSYVHREIDRVGYFPASPSMLDASKLALLKALGSHSTGDLHATTQAQAKATDEKTKMVLGGLGYDASRVIAHVLKTIIEERFEYDVDVVRSDLDTIFEGMDRGDGSIDVCPEISLPNNRTHWDKYIAKGSRGSVLVNTQPYPSIQGLFVPGYIQDEHGLTSVEQLLDPAIGQLFDSDGDGKGDYWPGEQDWNSTRVELVKAESYGYAAHFDALMVDEAVFKAILKARYQQKKGILFYSWTPEWIHAAYDLRRLEEPAFNGYAMASMKSDASYNPDGCWRLFSPKEDESWLSNSHITCAWPAGKMYVAYSKSLLTRAPKVASFLQQVAFDPVMLNDWVRQVGEQQRDPADVANKWVRDHADVVEQWLAGIEG